MRAMHDRGNPASAAREERPATAQRAHPLLDPTGLLALQRAVGNAATGAVLARRRLIARYPDEAKIRARAYQLYEGSGGGVRSREEDEANYFEALRQVEIEERAHAIGQQRGGDDPVANYYEAERQIAEERKPTPPVEGPKPPVEAAKPVIEQVKPEPAPEAKLEAPKPPAKFVPPHMREGFKPMAEVKTAPAKPAPGVYHADQLKRLGFERMSGNHLQLGVPRWEGFDVHVSVYHDRGTFNELHVKFDLGTHGSAWFFFDTAGKLLPDKTSPEGTRKKLLRADGCREGQLPAGLARMTKVAQQEADWVVSRLK